MALTGNNPVSKQEIVDRFAQVVRDYVTANTDWTSGTGVWNTTVGGVTGGAAYSTVNPGIPSASSVGTYTQANTGATDSVTKVFRDFMSLYARNHRIRLFNTGNLAPGEYLGVVRLNTDHGLSSQVVSDYDFQISNNNFFGDQDIDASRLENFLTAIRDSWDTRCHSISYAAQYNYDYCHSSHSNHGNHGSRGRR